MCLRLTTIYRLIFIIRKAIAQRDRRIPVFGVSKTSLILWQRENKIGAWITFERI